MQATIQSIRFPAFPSEPLAVSVREAAKLLSVSEKSVWNMAKRGDIQSKKIGSRVVFPVSSIRAFLEGPAEGEQ